MIEHVERFEAKEQVCSFRYGKLFLRRGIEIDFIRPAQDVPPGVTPIVSCRLGEGSSIQAGMGRRRIILHASDMGRPLYQSMGFEAGSKIPLFSPA
jgi:hypothetical protein